MKWMGVIIQNRVYEWCWPTHDLISSEYVFASLPFISTALEIYLYLNQSVVTLVVLSVHFNSISVFQFDFTCTEVLVCYHTLLKLGPWTKWQNLGTCWAIFSSFSQKKRGGKRLCVFLTVKLEKGFCQLKLMSNWFNFVCLFLQLHKDKVSTVVAWEAAA